VALNTINHYLKTSMEIVGSITTQVKDYKVVICWLY